MKSSVGESDLDVPRDRNGSFEPQILKKSQTHMSDEIEKKILSLFIYQEIFDILEYGKNMKLEDAFCIA